MISIPSIWALSVWGVMSKLTLMVCGTYIYKTISDGGITVYFWIIKVHTSN